MPLAGEKRRLGKTGLAVTALGLGGAPLGDFYERIPEDRASATLAAAYRDGIRLFDTSPAYGLGLSERRFGDALRATADRDFVLSTKVGRYLVPEAQEKVERYGFKGGLNMRIVADYGYDGTMRAIDQSFQRLGIDRIDLVHIHDVDVRAQGSRAAFEAVFEVAADGGYRALDELRRQKVIAAISLGVHEVEPCLRFAAAGDFDCFMIAGPYTLLNQEALDDLMPLCLKRSISLLVGGPFASGILATGAVAGARFNYRAAEGDILARVRKIEAVCARHGVPLRAAALQFPLRHPAVASVVAGAVSPAEVADNVDLIAAPIPDDFWAELKAERLIRADAP